MSLKTKGKSLLTLFGYFIRWLFMRLGRGISSTMYDAGTMAMGAWMRALVSGFPGPAVFASHDGKIAMRNRAAAGVLTVIETGGERLRGDLGDRAVALAKANASDRWLVSIDGKETTATRNFLVAAITFPGNDQHEAVVAFLGWENTLEVSLRSALSESRAFFRDIATSSGDFIWATDADGVFTYASPSGFRGTSAAQLHGTHWSDMFADPLDCKAAAAVFDSETLVEGHDVWLGSGAEKCCYRMTARPVMTRSGEWRGARGVARDVTDLMARQQGASQARASEDRLNQVLHNIRHEVDPQAMLSTAASSVVDATGFDGCWIFQRKPGEAFNAETADVIDACPRGRTARSETENGAALRSLAKRVVEQEGRSRAVEISEGAWHYLAVPARRSGEICGVICIGQHDETGAGSATEPSADRWSETSRYFATQIADQVAVAIAQAEHYEKLRVMTKTDALTGLANRPAFIEEASRRLSHHRRMKRRAALLIVDVDDFRNINEVEGQKRGDEVLSTVATLIGSRMRDSDLAARFGGDEFALWFEESDETIAMLKAGDLVEGCTGLNARNDADEAVDITPPIGISIGIAVFNPASPEALDSLILRASAALDETRKTGKGGYRIATPVEGPDCSLQLKQNFPDTRPTTGSET